MLLVYTGSIDSL